MLNRMGCIESFFVISLQCILIADYYNIENNLKNYEGEGRGYIKDKISIFIVIKFYNLLI